MTNVLDTIMAERRADAQRAMREIPVESLSAQARGWTRRSLVQALRQASGSRIVAEVKRASPSAGVIRPGGDPADIALGYERAGAIGLSVLTEPRHFSGSRADLRAVRDAVALPVLRKDFMCTDYQIHEAAAWGADVVLLIVAGLPRDVLLRLHAVAVEDGLETLVEIHAESELDLALQCDSAIVGVNSRNLKTLETDLSVARTLAPAIPRDRVSIAESGIRTREEIVELEELGYNGFLVGSTLMKAARPSEKLRQLLGRGCSNG
ncbi:MAG: indole-3-glycerol phosphate synthase TrpC [Kiritimatiellae bacterium]|nr:indole-3-glycerol phosphate synthase TrpC [Kiritimatiellia bacterium]